MIKRLDITPAMEDALALVARTEEIYRPGVDFYTFLELPKLALADATIAALRAQEARRRRRVAKLPTRAVGPVVEIEMRPKRRRA